VGILTGTTILGRRPRVSTVDDRYAKCYTLHMIVCGLRQEATVSLIVPVAACVGAAKVNGLCEVEGAMYAVGPTLAPQPSAHACMRTSANSACVLMSNLSVGSGVHRPTTNATYVQARVLLGVRRVLLGVRQHHYACTGAGSFVSSTTFMSHFSSRRAMRWPREMRWTSRSIAE